MICLHPTVTHNQSSLLRLRVRTGMKIVMGQKYARLINNDGSVPKMKSSKAKAAPYFPTDWNGGSAA